MTTRRPTRFLGIVGLVLAVFVAGRPGEVRAAFPGGNGKIAFNRIVNGASGAVNDIWVIHPDGTGETNLTNSTAEERYPDFSPDGSRIAFLKRESGQSAIVVMDADGSDQRTVVSAPALTFEFPTWSSDGTKIAAAVLNSSLVSEIKVYRASDGQVVDTFSPPAGGGFFNPAWRPTAAGATDIAVLEIYADGKRDIVRLTSSGEVNVTNTPTDFVEGGQLNWSPDGQRVLYRRRGGTQAELDVMSVDMNGNQLELQQPSGNSGAGQELSPDGGVLLFDDGSIGSATAPIYRVSQPGGTPVQLTTGTHPSWGRGPGDGFQVTLEAFKPTGETAEGQLLVLQDYTVKLTLSNGTNSKLDTFSFDGGRPIVVNNKSIGALAITSTPTIDPNLSLDPGESAEYFFAVTTTREGIVAAHSKVTARDEHGDDVEEHHSLLFHIENAQAVTAELRRYVLMKAMDDYLFAQFRAFQGHMQQRAQRLHAALTKRMTAQERLDWFGSTGRIEVTNLDVAAGFLQGLPPELFAASRPKVTGGHSAEEMNAAYDEAFKEEAGKGLAKWVQGYKDLASGAKGLAEEGWAAALMNVGWLNSTATAEERAQVESFWTSFADGSATSAKSLARQWKNEADNWQANGKYMWQALEEADREWLSVKGQVSKFKKGYDLGAGIVKRETDLRASLMKLAKDDPVAFQREWAKQDARIMNAFLPFVLDTLMGAGVAKVASVGGQALKFKPKGGVTLLAGAKEAGYVDDAGHAVASNAKLLRSDPDLPSGLPQHTAAPLTKAESFLKDTKGATLVQSSDHGNVYKLKDFNGSGVPETTIDAKAGILSDLEKEYKAAYGSDLKLVEVLKTSSALRKPGGVAKLELTAAKTGKPSMVDAGMPPDALGEAAYWTSPTPPPDLPGFSKLSRARQEAAITEWENANKRYAAYENPLPNTKEAHLKDLIGKRGRVPLDDNPNAQGIQRFINGEFEEVVVQKNGATAKLIRVKHYEVEVVEHYVDANNVAQTRVLNRKTVVDNLATSAPQTADADAVAVGKLKGYDASGAPIVEPLSRQEREFVMGRYVDKNIKARRAGLIPDNAEHGVTLVMEDASAKAAGFLIPRYGAVFLPQSVGIGYLSRIAPFVNYTGSGRSDAYMFQSLLQTVTKEGGFGQHAVVITSDSRYLGAVPFASW